MLAEREAAKYPFLQVGLELLEALDLQLVELASPTYTKAVDRAKDRVIEAIIQGAVSAQLADPQTELLSYPIAVMFVTLIGEHFLNRRYALSEAVRVYGLLQEEYEEKILQIARDEFKWKIRQDPRNIDGVLHNLKLFFTDYLDVASGFHEAKWKLVNRMMEAGYVSITGIEAARLL